MIIVMHLLDLLAYTQLLYVLTSYSVSDTCSKMHKLMLLKTYDGINELSKMYQTVYDTDVHAQMFRNY